MKVCILMGSPRKQGNTNALLGPFRQELEGLFQAKINLQCWVKVKEDWRNRQGLLNSFGYRL